MEYANINQPVLRITDKQLFDYIFCPNFFYFKYLSHIPNKKKKTTGEMVKEIINYYFAKLMQHKLPSIDTLKKKWDDLCNENAENMNNKTVLEGFGLINLFDKYCKNTKLIVADFDSEYQLNFSSNIILTGNLGAIRLVNKTLELFVVETSQKTPDQRLLDMSLKYTLACLAAEKIYKGYELNYVNILHLKSGKEFKTYRNKTQKDRLEKSVINIAKSIREEIFFPRENYQCVQCTYKNFCGYN